MINSKQSYLAKLYKILFTLILSILFPVILNSQQWTDPINISNGGINFSPDICFDYNNNLHVVWTKKIDDVLRKIYYSKSTDFGNTWSTPFDLSQNNELQYGTSHILSDSQNNLYVSYEHNVGNPAQTMIYLKIYDGTSWSEPILVTEDLPGSDHSFLVIDDNDRLYVFWAYYDNGNVFYYRYLEDSNWSEVYCPYCDTIGQFFFNNCVSDTDNNLHCVGSSFNYQINYDNIAYYFFNDASGEWSEPETLTENILYIGNDIDLDSSELPHLVWRERTSPAPPYNDATFYAYFNGINWSPPEMIIEDPWEQRIEIDDNGNINIFNREKTPIGYQLVHYLNYGNVWEGYIIDTSVYLTSTPQIVEKNSKLNIVYMKTNPGGTYADIWFSKTDIYTNIPEEQTNNHFDYFEIYPNPFNTKTHIKFRLNNTAYVNLYVFNLYGKLTTTLVNEIKPPGEYNYTWEGNDKKGNKVPTGLYLIRLQADRHTITRSVEYIK